MSGMDAQILCGIQEFAHIRNWQLFNANTDWGFQQVQENAHLLDGVIGVIADDERADWIRQMNRPVVNVSNTFPERFGFPAVLTDDSRIGELAADYFLERGYEDFAVYFLPGEHPYQYINVRAEAFARAVQQRGKHCCGILDLYPDGREKPFQEKGWRMTCLRDLPKPCGIFCVDDQQGSMVSFLCLSRGLNIPTEVGVIGVDNFELYCRMSNPPLTSMDPDGQRIGRTAAETLQRLIPLGKSTSYEVTLVPPKGVVSRSTVDTSAIQNPLLARTRQYILEHSRERINVTDIVRGVATNRRKLEVLHQKYHGHTLLQALNEARLTHARRLIQDTDLPFYKIASLCGFRDAHQMNRVFARSDTPSPKELRK
jgi:LacI family transcriptional regulator